MSAQLMRVLFCEDEQYDLELIQYELRGLATVHGVDTRERLAAALKESWDLILLDLRMPGLDGEEAMRMARTSQPAVPIIIVTGSVDDETAAIACQSGACDYLRKDRLRRLRMAVINAVDDARRKGKELLSERLGILGESMVGFAHDVNNMLGVILAAVDVLRIRINPMDERILDMINSTVQRAAEMQKQVLAFGRGGGSEQHQVSAEYLVGEIGAMLRSTFPSNIRLLIRTSAGTAQVRCDETQISQCLLNLCINARDSMPNGGELVINAQNVRLRDPDGDYVCITVRDTGGGISEEALPRIFEPFFSTKGAKGTGLGLALVKQIIAAHAGRVEVASSPAGTEFQVYLPVARDGDQAKPTFDGQKKTILLVEDTEFLRTWARLFLEGANYLVIEAPSGPAAMNLFLASMDSIDALVTDLGMPIMGGSQLAKACLELKPALPIIYITGIGSGGVLQEPAPTATLRKPFTSIQLLQLLKDVLR
jgi:signal transduction histidine kinase